MLETESATWAAAGAAALAVLALGLGFALVARWRRATSTGLAGLTDATRRTEELLRDLALALERLEAPATEGPALAGPETTLDLETALSRALQAAALELEADGALIALRRAGDEPLVATSGLAGQEAAQELAKLEDDGGPGRAVRVDYLYAADDAEDVFRITTGLAVPLVDEDEHRVGTLALFWRHGRAGPDEAAVKRFEELAHPFASMLEHARRYAEARRLAERDAETGLPNSRYFHERLEREVVRAHRYNRRLALMLFDLTQTASPWSLEEAGVRIQAVTRASDVACHLDEGLFALILPESGRLDAERLLRRLQFSVGARVDSPSDRLRLLSSTSELGAEDDGAALFEQADALLSRSIAADASASLEAAPEADTL